MPSNDVHSEELEKKVRWILDTRHTVPTGKSYTDTYAGRIVDFIESYTANAVRDARIDELDNLQADVYTTAGGKAFGEQLTSDRIQSLNEGIRIKL